MTISSRTPEGEPNRCPVCGHAFRLEPSRPFGDAPCPACGLLLWFAADGGETRYLDPGASGLAEWLAERLGVRPEEVTAARLDAAGVDSLDLVEWLLEWEERRGGGDKTRRLTASPPSGPAPTNMRTRTERP